MTSPEPARLVSFDSTPLHVPTCTFGRHKSYRNGEFNSYIIACINSLEKAEFTTSIHLIYRFSKSGIPIYNFKVPKKMGRRTINHLHERSLRVVYNDYASTFKDLSKLDSTTSIQIRWCVCELLRCTISRIMFTIT